MCGRPGRRVSKPGSRLEAALQELCEKHGYCLSGEKTEALLTDVPEHADTFVDAVLIAEGRNPTLIDKGEWYELREIVRDWLFDDGKGRGAKSGLPRFPLAAR
jgi:hypothetical protein